ncbi:unnamed protein product [Knipowitschia caucasica]|uniref:Uncharacterized protein n=1 Tax=Knipowitschia caucasica TaxID=637954 RepID=A0AAV2LHY8_KNICA
MRMIRASILFLFMVFTSAQREKKFHKPVLDTRNEAERASRGCTNLTVVLDNWKYAIVTQVKDLLLNDHRTVLPDYGRIQPLSDALGDLYKEFNALKDRLSDLTSKFHSVEGFVDELRSGRKPSTSPRGDPPAPGGEAGGEAQSPGIDSGFRRGRRTRVVVRRVQRPVSSEPGRV